MTIKTGYRNLIKGRCPKCHGTMVLDFDYEVGDYKSCLNCGYVAYFNSHVSGRIAVVDTDNRNDAPMKQVQMALSQRKN